MTPLDMQRLSLRIETLRRQSTYGWAPADELEFRGILLNPGNPRHLPEPKALQEMAKKGETPSPGTYQSWLHWAQHLEGLVHANRPGNPRRMMRDMMQGKVPFLR